MKLTVADSVKPGEFSIALTSLRSVPTQTSSSAPNVIIPTPSSSIVLPSMPPDTAASGLSQGAIAGIAVGSVVGVGAISAVGLVLFLRARRTGGAKAGLSKAEADVGSFPAPEPPPQSEDKPAPTHTREFNPYPGPNDAQS